MVFKNIYTYMNIDMCTNACILHWVKAGAEPLTACHESELKAQQGPHSLHIYLRNLQKHLQKISQTSSTSFI